MHRNPLFLCTEGTLAEVRGGWRAPGGGEGTPLPPPRVEPPAAWVQWGPGALAPALLPLVGVSASPAPSQQPGAKEALEPGEGTSPVSR